MNLSIIVPVYNEEKTIEKILKKLESVPMKTSREIIIVDDGSTDNSIKIAKEFITHSSNKKISYQIISKKNQGKGSAVRRGIKEARGGIITIQDADLEYDPSDFNILINAMLKSKSSVVYGSRFMKKHKPMYRIYYAGNKFLTLLTKMLYNSTITDMETCYKMFKSDVIKSLNLKSDGFDIEPEITAKILKKGIKIHEVPIGYNPRRIEEGKKINWKDGLKAIWVLISLRFSD